MSKHGVVLLPSQKTTKLKNLSHSHANCLLRPSAPIFISRTEFPFRFLLEHVASVSSRSSHLLSLNWHILFFFYSFYRVVKAYIFSSSNKKLRSLPCFLSPTTPTPSNNGFYPSFNTKIKSREEFWDF